MTGEFSVLGRSVPRKDAVEKVKGEAKCLPDIQLPGMLHAKFLRSPHAHARIKSINVSKAEALPGLKCVLTHQNVPKVHPQKKLEYLLDETVHYPGEEVAAVAALSAEIAQEALKLIDVEYEIYPAVFDLEEAMKPDAPLVHREYGTNVYHGSELVRIPRIDEDGWLRLEAGDVDKGFSEADYVLDGTYKTPMQYPCSPMPRSVICEWTGDKLTCWADTHTPLSALQELAKNLSIPQSKIRVIANHSVGGYGHKNPGKISTLTAIMAKRTSRPVKAAFSRAEDFIATHRRVSFKTYNKVGVKKDGTITAMYSQIIANRGSDTYTPYRLQGTALLNSCTMLYRWQNSKAETCGVMTNTLGYGAVNGFGDPEATYSIERILDEAAEKINMDPVEFRYKNCARYGDKALLVEQVINGPIKWGILGSDLDSLPELIRKCAQAAQWKDKWRGWRTPVAVHGPKKQGIGIAIGMHHTNFGPSSAIVKMNQDGTATVLSGAVEIGQGYATVVAQVVAETLGIRYEDVNPILADTGAAPADRGNVGSAGVSRPVNAAKLAAEDVKRKLFELAAPKLKTTIDTLEARNGNICVKGTRNKIPIADICSKSWQVTGTANNPPVDSIKDEKSGQIIRAFAAAATIAEVEVDIETGKIDVIRITSGHDCGRAINPVMIENQIDMGLTMANGWVCTEDYLIDSKTGIVMNPNLLDYKLITFLDTPKSDDVHRIIAEKPCAWGPFGAKGFSETAMTALAPAIANAVYNAIGVRLYDGSLFPRNILSAIEKANRGKQS